MTVPGAPDLADRLDVVDACTRMGWLADRRDWAALVDVFTDRVDVDYSALTGDAGGPVPAVDLVAGWEQGLTAWATTHHAVTGHLVAVDGDSATCTAVVTATHVSPSRAEPWVLGGRYAYALRRVDACWRVSGVVLHVDWQQGEPAP